jgi:chromate transporter
MADAPGETLSGLSPATPPALAQPQSLTELFVAFTWLALQGFGGVIAVAQRELCERRRWLDAREFLDLLATAQVLPGPNVCNLSLMVGDRFFGWRGALTALAGMIALPMALVLMIAWALGEASHLPQAQGLIRGALGGIAAVAAGQIIGTVLRLSAPLRAHELGWPACLGLAAVAFALVLQWQWPLVQVLLGLGGAACLVSYAVLKRRPPQPQPDDPVA